MSGGIAGQRSRSWRAAFSRRQDRRRSKKNSDQFLHILRKPHRYIQIQASTTENDAFFCLAFWCGAMHFNGSDVNDSVVIHELAGSALVDNDAVQAEASRRAAIYGGDSSKLKSHGVIVATVRSAPGVFVVKVRLI